MRGIVGNGACAVKVLLCSEDMSLIPVSKSCYASYGNGFADILCLSYGRDL